MAVPSNPSEVVEQYAICRQLPRDEYETSRVCICSSEFAERGAQSLRPPVRDDTILQVAGAERRIESVESSLLDRLLRKSQTLVQTQ